MDAVALRRGCSPRREPGVCQRLIAMTFAWWRNLDLPPHVPLGAGLPTPPPR